MKSSCKKLEKKIRNKKQRKKRKSPVIHIRLPNGRMKAIKIKSVQIILNPLNDEEWKELKNSLESEEE